MQTMLDPAPRFAGRAGTAPRPGARQADAPAGHAPACSSTPDSVHNSGRMRT